MAFKSMVSYQEEKRGDLFQLENDGDYADVIFLFRSIDDALMAKVHYVKFSTYSGYVQCLETDDCPICKKGIRTQDKLFIPLFNINRNKIEVFDRTAFFRPQLMKDVFANFPNPSEYVFRITRNGAAHDQNTTYKIEIRGKVANGFDYASILANNGHKDISTVYELVCKDMDKAAIENMIALDQSSAPVNTEYVPQPRASAAAPVLPETEPVDTPTVDISGFSQPDDAAQAVPNIIATIPEVPADEESNDLEDTLSDVKF